MPIKPENRARYPADWRDISDRIRFERAGGRCECDGRCGHDHCAENALEGVSDVGRCAARHSHAHPITDSTVVLTVAHLDHDPENCPDDNLMAMCQRCHLAYDAEHHAQSRYYEQRCSGTDDMFGDEP